MIASTISEASKLSFSGRRIARLFSFAWALRLCWRPRSLMWFIRAHSQRQAAAALFAEAKDPAAWREVIEKYPGSAPAANAYLLLADSLRREGKLEESSAQYEKFLAAFPKSSLLGWRAAWSGRKHGGGGKNRRGPGCVAVGYGKRTAAAMPHLSPPFWKAASSCGVESLMKRVRFSPILFPAILARRLRAPPVLSWMPSFRSYPRKPEKTKD